MMRKLYILAVLISAVYSQSWEATVGDTASYEQDEGAVSLSSEIESTPGTTDDDNILEAVSELRATFLKEMGAQKAELKEIKNAILARGIQGGQMDQRWFKWTDLMRIDKGSRRNVYNEWQNITKNMDWTAQLVRLSMFANGTEVVHLVFRAHGTTAESWMTPDNLIGQLSAYDDLGLGVHNFFGINGHKSEYVSRRFMVNEKYHGCPRDVGWMFVMDTDHPLRACPYETELPRLGAVKKADLPQFIYCPPPRKCVFNNDRLVADEFVVSVT